MFDKAVLLGVIRHILTAGGGALVTQGVLAAGEVEVIVGGLVTLVGVVWSVLQKKK